jgi:hypothetical protein
LGFCGIAIANLPPDVTYTLAESPFQGKQKSANTALLF